MLQQPHQAMSGCFDDPLDVGITQGGAGTNTGAAPALSQAYTPSSISMEMRIQVQCTSETLDKGHRAALDLGVALRPRLLAMPGLDRAEKNRQKSTAKRAVVG